MYEKVDDFWFVIHQKIFWKKGKGKSILFFRNLLKNYNLNMKSDAGLWKNV